MSSASIMSSEIAEQADAIDATLARLSQSRSAVQNFFAGAQSVLFMARGTSDNVADYGQYLLSTKSGILANSGSPSIATAFNAQNCACISVGMPGYGAVEISTASGLLSFISK